MLSCNQSKLERAFYLWNVSGYWRIKDEKTGLKGALDLDHGGMRHGGIQASVRQAALHQGERKEKEEVKSEDSNIHLTDTITIKIHDILPKPQPKAHICQILFNIIQVQEEERHWTASPPEHMAIEFDLHCWNAQFVRLGLLWLKFRNEMTVKVSVSVSDTHSLWSFKQYLSQKLPSFQKNEIVFF